uniref:Uncharacterized protein n=1 Tax=Rhizophora mucronata TaxID=61149 RepID=A0A2P2PH52_RHIMU
MPGYELDGFDLKNAVVRLSCIYLSFSASTNCIF